jgi:hypothetical protein
MKLTLRVRLFPAAWARHRPGPRTARYDEIGLVTCRCRCRCHDRFGRLVVLTRVVTTASLIERRGRGARGNQRAPENSGAARSVFAAPSSFGLVGNHRLETASQCRDVAGSTVCLAGTCPSARYAYRRRGRGLSGPVSDLTTRCGGRQARPLCIRRWRSPRPVRRHKDDAVAFMAQIPMDSSTTRKDGRSQRPRPSRLPACMRSSKPERAIPQSALRPRRGRPQSPGGRQWLAAVQESRYPGVTAQGAV